MTTSPTLLAVAFLLGLTNPTLLTPDPTLTPGAVCETSTPTICQPGYSRTQRHTTPEMKKETFRRYHLDPHSDRFEIDHLVPLELGGCDTPENLWPQSYTTPMWNAHVKDRLEDHLHREVCNGTISLPDAQRAFLAPADWRDAYRQYLGAPQ